VARVCAEAGVDSVEHGFELDADVVRLMAAHGVALVTTMTVLKSWLTFSTTTALPRFAGAENRARIMERGRGDQGGRARRLLARARRPAERSHGALARVAGGLTFLSVA
jgi:hypothetical protein